MDSNGRKLQINNPEKVIKDIQAYFRDECDSGFFSTEGYFIYCARFRLFNYC